MADQFQARTLKRKNVKGLALNAPPARTVKPSDGDAQFPGSRANTDGPKADTLEIGLEFQLDLRSEDLIVLKELGAGNGGTVSKVMHATTKVVMARKVIRVDAKETVRKQILRELQVGSDCRSEYVITYYGAFQNEARDIVLCMEYMDCGSLDRISRDFGPLRVDVLGKVTEAILAGLVYLYEVHRIMHRDIKPSNVLVNSRGMIKLCDFGVATETVNSVANTFVGTSTYMAPERISGGIYTVKSDVWSVGLTVMELAVGRFPFASGDASGGEWAEAGPMGILDLLQTIVHEPAPKLPKSEAFPPILDDFIAKCLLKSPDERPTPRQLYDHDAFLQAAKRTPVDLQEWAVSMMDRHNRRSYLAPPAPRSLKTDDVSADAGYSSAKPAPTVATTAHIAQKPNIPSERTTPMPGRGVINSSHRDAQAMPQQGYYSQPDAYVTPTESTPKGVPRSPSPPLSLQHLSLEVPDGSNGITSSMSRSNRLNYDPRNDIPEPASAIEPSRPFFPPRTSSNPHLLSARIAPSSGNLPMRPPPPTGPLPPPPTKDLPQPSAFRRGLPASPRQNR